MSNTVKILSKINKAWYEELLEAFKATQLTIMKNFNEKYLIKDNIHKSICAENSKISFGLCSERQPYEFIFTITNDYELIWEVFLKYFDINLTEYIEHLLWKTHHILLVGIWEINRAKFYEIWEELSYFIKNNSYGIKLKSIAFIPNSSEIESRVEFDNKILYTLRKVLEFNRPSISNISFTFVRFYYKEATLFEQLLDFIPNKKVKFICCKNHLGSLFVELFMMLKFKSLFLLKIAQINEYSNHKVYDLSKLEMKINEMMQFLRRVLSNLIWWLDNHDWDRFFKISK